jgi:hypothetical protein
MMKRPQDGHGPAGAEDDGLAAAFAAERAVSPVPSGALMARILSDAAATGKARTAAALRPALLPEAPFVARRPRRALSDLVALLGGWPAMGGMATAALTGIWIGFAGSSNPGGLAGLVGLSAAASGASVVELLPVSDAFEMAGTAGGEM